MHLVSPAAASPGAGRAVFPTLLEVSFKIGGHLRLLPLKRQKDFPPTHQKREFQLYHEELPHGLLRVIRSGHFFPAGNWVISSQGRVMMLGAAC